MPSFSALSTAAILALSGVASAIPSYNTTTSPYGNSTSPGSTGGSTGGSSSSGNSTITPSSDAAFCPVLNGGFYFGPGGITWAIACDKSHFGVQIVINVDISKRATYNSLGDCIDLCTNTDTCVGTAFNKNTRQCTLFSSVGQEVDAPGIDFALIAARPGTGATGGDGSDSGSGTGTGTGSSGTGSGADAGSNGGSVVPAGGMLTSTIFSTTAVTISSCAPTVTNCPLRNNAGGVVYQVIPVSSTVYVCPAETTLPAAPVACTGCPASLSTGTLYSATSKSGSTSMVPMKTVVVNYPVPTGTQNVVTTCTACAAATATSTGTGSVTGPSGVAMYTGAAGQVKAGMGFAAFVAGAAVLL